MVNATLKIRFLLITVHDLKLSQFFTKKTAKKYDNLKGTFTQKILFLDSDKTKKAKSVTI